MTTPEHAMVGITGALAAGLHRRFGWQLIVVAGVAAISPDWDGVVVLWSAQLFDQIHRVWGHNVFVCGLIGALIGWSDLRWNWTTSLKNCLAWLVHDPRLRTDESGGVAPRRTLAWILVATAAAMSHLPADLVYSGGAGLPDWELQLFWPLTTRGFVFPLVPWGDAGITLIFVIGTVAMFRRTEQVVGLARCTLGGLVAYLVLRNVTVDFIRDQFSPG